MYHLLLQIDGDFAVDLFGELARAYLAAINTRSQVMTPCNMKNFSVIWMLL